LDFVLLQLLLRSKTRYFSRGSIIADSKEDAKGLIVITAGQVSIVFDQQASSLNTKQNTILRLSNHQIYTFKLPPSKGFECRWGQKFPWTQRMLMMQTETTMEGPYSMCSSAGIAKKSK
jgi:hypothetical protein